MTTPSPSPRARLRRESPYLTLRTAAARTYYADPQTLSRKFVLPSRRPKPRGLQAMWETL